MLYIIIPVLDISMRFTSPWPGAEVDGRQHGTSEARGGCEEARERAEGA